MCPIQPNSSAPRAIQPRDRYLARLRSEIFDLAVIGGGINGAAIARDAAIRGLKVALIDKGDFAGATSSRSSKLIHGGLRYLPQGHLTLVYKALRERERLRHRTAPHLVRPIRFLFPFYRGRYPGRLAVSVGLVLYDLFARTPAPERHRRLAPADVIAAEPILDRSGLTGGAFYSDAAADDARLVLENVIDAALHGAAVANYVAVEGFDHLGLTLVAAAARDQVAGSTFEIRARRFVNATGPWVDDLRRLDNPSASPTVRLTKGVHLVIRHERIPLRNPLVLEDGHGRIVFVMPHGKYVTVGTTDTDFAGNRDEVAADQADITYLAGIVSGSIPSLKLDQTDVAYSFAGLRALAADGDESPSSVSREEIITENPSGLLSIAGGKLTTHREIAERIVDRIAKSLGHRIGERVTADYPLPGARTIDLPDRTFNLAPEIRVILGDRYGTRAAIVGKIAAERPELAHPLTPGCPAIGAEVVHAVRNEFAVSLKDFMVGRIALVWRAPLEAAAAAPVAARIMATELGWDRKREQDEIESFWRGPGSQIAASNDSSRTQSRPSAELSRIR